MVREVGERALMLMTVAGSVRAEPPEHPLGQHRHRSRRQGRNLRGTPVRGSRGRRLQGHQRPYTPGRPASGGTQLKFKFVETASFIVTGHNDKRSVALGLLDGDGQPVPAGNVTIPPNHAIPPLGTVVESRYLYAHRESGSIYQPVYLGPRDDIPAEECTTDQLKFKTAAAEL